MSEKHLNDTELFQKCQRYGANAKFWRQKFLGLLPEVNKRRLYEKKGFSSIFVFAAKLGGISEKQVRIALNLKEKFATKPALQALLISGEVSINKLARVASIATAENEEALAAQTKVLSKSALETLVRYEKFAQILISQNQIENNFQQTFETQNDYNKPTITPKSLPGHCEASLVEKSVFTNSINKDLELLKHLPENLKTRLTTMAQKGINIGELLNDLLDKHEEEIALEKAELAQQQNSKHQAAAQNIAQIDGQVVLPPAKPTKPSRHIPIKIRRLLTREHGTKCSIPNCKQPSKTLHHTQRFALAQTHNPHYLAPLCSDHHQIAHSIDQRFVAIRQTSTS
jgi:hypothetical protein